MLLRWLHSAFVSLPLRIPRWVWGSLCLGWTLVLIGLSLWSGPGDIEFSLLSLFWNFAHAPCYGILAFLFFYACAKPMDSSAVRKRLYLGLGLVLAVGILSEWIQSFTPSRSASLFDVMTDFFGGICFALLLDFFWENSRAWPSFWARLLIPLTCAVVSSRLDSVFC